VALGWFTLATLAWILASLHSIGSSIGLPEPLWAALAALLQGLSALAMLRFGLAWQGLRLPTAARLATLYALLGLVALSLFLTHLWPRALQIWLWPVMIIPAALALLFLRPPADGRLTPVNLALGLAALANVAAGVHDLLLYGNRLDFAEVPWLPYGLSFLLVAVGSALLLRFAEALAETEALNTTLEARVAQKHADLEASYARTRALELAEASAAERARLTRDMHDGMGGQLISALASAEGGRLAPTDLAALIRECIDDMRLLIDALEPGEQDLAALLGNLRYRLEPRLAAAGLRLRWRLADPVGPPDLTPRECLQVLRVIQEALTNVIKHANASEVTVGSDDAGGIYVRDNGSGMRPTEPARGRGTSNMAQRARAAGASLSIASATSGTEVRLCWLRTATPA
jgi:signal transduction histidine kinase